MLYNICNYILYNIYAYNKKEGRRMLPGSPAEPTVSYCKRQDSRVLTFSSTDLCPLAAHLPALLPCTPAAPSSLELHTQPLNRQTSLSQPPPHFQRLQNVALLHIILVLVMTIGIIVQSNQEILQACCENLSGCLHR